MKTEKNLNNFAVGIVAALAPANLLHLGWTIWLAIEQIETGWNGGTGIEMLALMLWLLEAICVPVLLVGVIYFAMSVFKQQSKRLLIANIVLFVCLVAQIVITNLFLLY